MPKKKDTHSVSFFFGASDEARTRYLHLGKVALYQMSYTRNNSGYYSGARRKSQPLNLKIREIFHAAG